MSKELLAPEPRWILSLDEPPQPAKLSNPAAQANSSARRPLRFKCMTTLERISIPLVRHVYVLTLTLKERGSCFEDLAIRTTEQLSRVEAGLNVGGAAGFELRFAFGFGKCLGVQISRRETNPLVRTYDSCDPAAAHYHIVIVKNGSLSRSDCALSLIKLHQDLVSAGRLNRCGCRLVTVSNLHCDPQWLI